MTIFLKRFYSNIYKISQNTSCKKTGRLLNKQEFPFSYQKLIFTNYDDEEKIDLGGEKPASLEKPTSLDDERLYSLPSKQPIELNQLFKQYRTNEQKDSEQSSSQINKDVERLRNEIDETLKKNLFSWDNSKKWDFILPNTIFVGDEPPVTFFKPKQMIGTQTLSKLSSEQIKSISEKGEFLLNSTNESDELGTTWKVNPWIVKGSDNITQTFNQNLSLSWRGLFQIPRRLLPKYSYQYDYMGNLFQPNFVSGLRTIFSVPSKLLNLLIGNRKMEMKSDEEVMQELYKEHVQKVLLELNDNITKAYFQYVKDIDEYIKDEPKNKVKLQEQEKVLAAIEAFRKEFKERVLKLEKEQLKILEKSDIDEDEGLFQLLMQEQKLLFSMMDEKNHPKGIEARNHLKDMIRAAQISVMHYESLQGKIQEKRDGICSEIEKNHPVKSLVESWKQENVEEQMKPIILELTAEFNQKVLEELEKEGLKEQGVLFKRFAEFQRNSQEMFKTNFDRIQQANQKPSRVIRTYQNILGEHEVKKYVNPDGIAHYSEVTTKSIDVPTSFYGWRIALYLVRCKAWTINSYDMLTKNLMDGPFGLRALFKSKPFYTSQNVDFKTGEKKPSGLTTTYRELLRQILAGIALSRKRFEDLPDRGLFGKNFARIFNYIECYIFRGLIAGSIVSVGFPIAVVINSIVSGILAITSFIWIPAAASLHWASNILFLDLDSPTRSTWRKLNPYYLSKQTLMAFPLFQVLGQLASGISESILSIACAAVLLPTTSLLGATFSYGRRIISKLTDELMLGLIKIFGRQPELDSALAWKVRGAGVARQYMNSIEIDDVKFLVRSWMERAELEEFEIRISRRILEPTSLYSSLVLDLFRSYGLSSSFNTYLSDNSKDLQTQLKKAAAKRRSVYPNLPSSNVKFTEEELQKLLPACEEIIRSFVKVRGDMAWIFAKNGIEGEDYKKLTELVLIQVFNDQDILYPFSEIDKRIEITSQKNTTYHAIQRAIDGECDLSVLASTVPAKYRKLKKTELCDLVDDQTILKGVRKVNSKFFSVTENDDPSDLCFYLPYWSFMKEQNKKENESDKNTKEN